MEPSAAGCAEGPLGLTAEGATYSFALDHRPLLLRVRDGSAAIASNTGSVITLDTANDGAWSRTPEAGDVIILGGIRWYQYSPDIDFGDPRVFKRGGFFYVQARTTGQTHALEVPVRLDGSLTPARTAVVYLHAERLRVGYRPVGTSPPGATCRGGR